MHRGRGGHAGGGQSDSGARAEGGGRGRRGGRERRGEQRTAGSQRGPEDDASEEPRRRRPEDRFGEGQFGDGQDWQQPRFLEGSRDAGAHAGYGPYEQEAAWLAGGAAEAGRRAGAASPPADRPLGPHAGKGPKNYRRSDERILDDVCQTLERHPDIDAREIEVACQNGEITLTGSVDTRRTRRLAEEVIEDLPGVRDVHNQLRAIPSAGQTFHGGREPGGGRFAPR